MTSAAVFTHHNTVWSQPVTLVRSGPAAGWKEIEHRQLTPLPIAGYRHRWDRMVWEADRRKVTAFWPHAAEFAAGRWQAEQPEAAAITEVRFVKVLRRASDPATAKPAGHWQLPPVAVLPAKDVVELAWCRKTDTGWARVGKWKKPAADTQAKPAQPELLPLGRPLLRRDTATPPAVAPLQRRKLPLPPVKSAGSP